jgi:hypothetical protein
MTGFRKENYTCNKVEAREVVFAQSQGTGAGNVVRSVQWATRRVTNDWMHATQVDVSLRCDAVHILGKTRVDDDDDDNIFDLYYVAL